MDLATSYPRIFYINLDTRTDRRTFMERQLSDAGVQYARFSAIKPTFESLVSREGEFHSFFQRGCPNYKKIARKRENAARLTSYFGVYLSHYRLHQMMADNPERDYVILEDDCVFERENLDAVLAQVENGRIPSDWDIIRDCWGSTKAVETFDRSHSTSKFSGLRRHHNHYGGAHFSLVRAQSARRLLDFLDEEYIFIIDAIYSTHKLNVYHSRFGFHPADMGTDVPKMPPKSRLSQKLGKIRRISERLMG